MITAKPFAIAGGASPVGGATYNLVGSKFSLLAASEPLNIKLFVKTQQVADLQGFTAGLDAGPFCPPFTMIQIETQSGNAGNAIIGVGDEDISYNPMAGTLTFSNPAVSANAQPVATNTNPLTSAQAGNYFSVAAVVPAVAAEFGFFQIDNNGAVNAKRATITGIRLTNPNAAALSFTIATFGSTYTPTTNPLQHNMLAGGPASLFACGVGSAASFGGVQQLLKNPTVEPNNTLDVQLDAPIVLPVGVLQSLEITAQTLDVPFTVEVLWTEDAG